MGCHPELNVGLISEKTKGRIRYKETHIVGQLCKSPRQAVVVYMGNDYPKKTLALSREDPDLVTSQTSSLAVIRLERVK